MWGKIMSRKILYIVAAAWVIAFLWQTYAHAAESDKTPSTGPFWISAFKISCGQKNGIWWQGMNGAGHFIRFYPSREETIDYLVKDNVLIVQGEPCKTEPFDCSIIGISAPGAERCGIALSQN